MTSTTTDAVVDLRTQFVRTTTDLLDTDPRVALALAEISVAQFDEAMQRHPGRVINVGIREQLLVSATGGLALSGLRPIAHTFGAFLIERAWEQVKLDLSHQDVGAVLVGSYGSYDWPAGGRTHQSPGDVALLDTLRDWTVHVPGHLAELDALLRAAVAREDRTYIRIGGVSNPQPHPTGGQWVALKRGSLGTVVAVGTALRATQEAVADLDTLRVTLGAPRVVLVEPYLAGTSSAHLGRALADRDHRQLALGVGDPDVHKYGEPADHDRIHGLDPGGVRASIVGFISAP